ncbi:rho guanine nucleotide exchange factor 40 isoform X3 [Amia ocellicauda]|uniref:rho guanine nucleotide exchange factor 40 isoform X3 n=1 Tax=Amia ocellicauda TaxID=2972642 RepID=UPI003464AD6A
MGSEAVEDCVQGALSSLYPPFEATAPPLLGQVFSVLEGTYRHDALRYLLDYFIPAKHLLHRLQQQACSQYVGCLFVHAGWPLCLGEKVVVQLSTLDWHLLGPRDFYLQVVPFSARCPRLALKCLSAGGRTVQEILIPESQHTHVFTPEWLNGINKERGGGGGERRLEMCLVTTGEGLVRLPWRDIVYPRFVLEPGCPADGGSPRSSPVFQGEDDPKGFRPAPGDWDPEVHTLPQTARELEDGHGNVEEDEDEDKEGYWTPPSPGKDPWPLEKELEEAGGEYVELLDFRSIPDHRAELEGQDMKQRYLEMHGISKTKTVPLLKKGKLAKGKRGKAWLHCRSDSKRTSSSSSSSSSFSPSSFSTSSSTSSAISSSSSSSSCSRKGKGKGVEDLRLSGEEFLSRPIPNVIDLPRNSDPDRYIRVLAQERPVGLSPWAPVGVPEGEVETGSERAAQERARDRKGKSGGGCQIGNQSASRGWDQETNGEAGIACKDQSEDLSGQAPNQSSDSRKGSNGELSQRERDPESQLVVHTGSPQPPLAREGDPPPRSLGSQDDVTADDSAHSPCPDHSTQTAPLRPCPKPGDRPCPAAPGSNPKQNPGQTSVSQCESGLNRGQEDPGAGHAGKREDKATPPRAKDVRAAGVRANRRRRKARGGKGKAKPVVQQPGRAAQREQVVKEKSSPHLIPESEMPPFSSSVCAPQQGLEGHAPDTTAASLSVGQSEQAWTHADGGQGSQPANEGAQQAGLDRTSTAGQDGQARTADQSETPPIQADSQSQVVCADHAPEEAEPAGLPDQSSASSCQTPLLLRDLNPALLQSGLLTLPGTMDKAGRAVVVMEMRSPNCSYRDDEIAQTLACLYGLTSCPARQQGLAMIVDCRQASPLTLPLGALTAYQERVPGGLGSVLFLVASDSEESAVPGIPGTEAQLVRGIRSLQSHVDSEQLPVNLGGTCAHSHAVWLSYRLRLESFSQCCESALCLLGETLHALETEPLPANNQAVPGSMQSHQQLMASVLADERLTLVQREGGAMLARLRKEVELPQLSPDCRAALAVTSELYESVDDSLHLLVRVSNQRGRDLEALSRLATLEEKLDKCECWLGEAEQLVRGFRDLGDCLELLSHKSQEFKLFSQTTMERCREACEMLSELEGSGAGAGAPGSPGGVARAEGRGPALRERLRSLTDTLEVCGTQLDKRLRLQSTLSEASQWCEEVQSRLSQAPPALCLSPSGCGHALSVLQHCCGDLPEIPASRFRDARALALELGGEGGVREVEGGSLFERWASVRARYDQTLSALRERLLLAQHCQRAKLSSTPSQSMSDLSADWTTSLANRGRDSETGGSETGGGGGVGTVLQSWGSLASLLLLPTPNSSSATLRVEELAERGKGRMGGGGAAKDPNSPPATSAQSNSSPPSRFLQALLHPSKKTPPDPPASVKPVRKRNPSFDLSALLAPRRASKDPGARVGPEGAVARGSPLSWLGRRAADTPPFITTPPSTPAVLGQAGGGGVLIRGLEVSSREVVDQTGSPRQHVLLGRSDRETAALDRHVAYSKAFQLWSGLLSSEREYVGMLRGVQEGYMTLMDAPDLPLHLRGKKSALFSNWEELTAFHSQYLLPAIEGTGTQPQRLAECFLKYKEQFLLYSLYMKAQPDLDCPLVSQASEYLKLRQQALGCPPPPAPLPSCLQAPLDQLKRYCELLEQLVALGPPHAPLTAAPTLAVLTRAQRHGHDLRASTHITGCPVDLSQQGELLRQEQLEVWGGRKRRGLRQVFLYHQLLLFTKRKTPQPGHHVFAYKNAIKTAELGLSQTEAGGGPCFSVWVRGGGQRDTLTLQAPSEESRAAWTLHLALILGGHALTNDEMCLKESLCMGVSSQLLLDLQRGAGGHSDRDLNYILLRGGSRTDAPPLRPLSLDLHCPGEDDFLGSSDSSSTGSGLSQKDLESPGSRKVTSKWPGQSSAPFGPGSESFSPSTAV